MLYGFQISSLDIKTQKNLLGKKKISHPYGFFLFTVNSVYAHAKVSIHIQIYIHRYLCAFISVIDKYAY